MASSKKKNIFIIILVLIIAGAIAAYLQWNKPHPKAEDQEAITINAETLYTAFTTDENKANTTYLNHVVAVDGTIGELSKNQDGKTVAVLSTTDPMGGIQCTFRDNVSLTNGQMVKVKGFCNGYTMVVLLNDCIINK